MKFQGSVVKASWNDMEQFKGRHYQGLLDGLTEIARAEGIASLWNGTLPSLLLVLNPGIQFMMYEILKRHLQSALGTMELNGGLYFAMGAISKMAATFATYPLQVIQSRFRYKNKFDRPSNAVARAFRTLYRIFVKQGFRGLYKGLEAKLLQTILTSALMFLCYEEISTFLFHWLAVRDARL